MYAGIQEEWWSTALRRVESRSKYQRFIGKRKVMDKFWARVYKESHAMLGDNECETKKRVEVAYGSASQTMPSHGRGEVAVPVSGAYISCVKTFGKDNVKVEKAMSST